MQAEARPTPAQSKSNQAQQPAAPKTQAQRNAESLHRAYVQASVKAPGRFWRTYHSGGPGSSGVIPQGSSPVPSPFSSSPAVPSPFSSLAAIPFSVWIVSRASA